MICVKMRAPCPLQPILRRAFAAFTYRDFRRPLVRRLHLDRRHLDAEGRAELAGLRAHQIVVLSRARRLPRAAADPALHADRRRHRRSPRSPAAAALGSQYVQMATALHAGRARLLGTRRRSGTSSRCRSSPASPRRSAARPISRWFRRSSNKKDLPNAIALNSIQFNLARVFGPLLAGATLAAFGTALCFGLNGLSFLVVIVALLSLSDQAHPADRSQADAAGAEGRPRLRAQPAGDRRADHPRVADDVPRAAAADVPADLRARDLPRRRRPLQRDDGVLGRRARSSARWSWRGSDGSSTWG